MNQYWWNIRHKFKLSKITSSVWKWLSSTTTLRFRPIRTLCATTLSESPNVIYFLNHSRPKFFLKWYTYRSNHQTCFIEKAALKNPTGKHPCWIQKWLHLHENNSTVLLISGSTLLKRNSNTDVFLGKLQNFKNAYFEEHLRTASMRITSLRSRDL